MGTCTCVNGKYCSQYLMGSHGRGSEMLMDGNTRVFIESGKQLFVRVIMVGLRLFLLHNNCTLIASHVGRDSYSRDMVSGP